MVDVLCIPPVDMIKHEDLQSGQKKRGRKAAPTKVQPRRGRAKKTEDVKQDKQAVMQ